MDLKLLRGIGYLEGLSFLFLLGVAMPLKYVWGNPSLIFYAGMTHGLMFLLFFFALLVVSHLRGWPVMMFVYGLLGAVLPFGTFVFDRKVVRFEEEREQA